jgi:hypothetical protein
MPNLRFLEIVERAKGLGINIQQGRVGYNIMSGRKLGTLMYHLGLKEWIVAFQPEIAKRMIHVRGMKILVELLECLNDDTVAAQKEAEVRPENFVGHTVETEDEPLKEINAEIGEIQNV